MTPPRAIYEPIRDDEVGACDDVMNLSLSLPSSLPGPYGNMAPPNPTEPRPTSPGSHRNQVHARMQTGLYPGVPHVPKYAEARPPYAAV